MTPGIDRWTSRLRLPSLVVLAIVLVVWEAVARRYGAYVMPSPRSVAEGLVAVVRAGEVWTHAGASLYRIAIGFGSAALAGALIAMLEQFSPFSGFPFTIAGFIVIILGGLGNVKAGLFAALLLGAIETYGVALTSANLRSVLLYGTFVAALLLFPNGLFGRPGARR